VNPGDPQKDHLEETTISTLLRRFFPFYCALAALVTFGYALYDGYQLDGDAVAYMDLGDLLRAHHWTGIVNGYWHPMYPAFLALGHTLSRATPPPNCGRTTSSTSGYFCWGWWPSYASPTRLCGCASQRVSKSAICWTAPCCATSD